MPSVTVRPLDLDANIRGALECSVCLLPYNTTTSKPVQLDPCGHCFCTECVPQLYDCPYCRTTISQRIPNRGLFDVVAAMDIARNSSGGSGLTTPLLAECRSITSDDRQCSCNCFRERAGCLFERMGAIMGLVGRRLAIMRGEIGFLLGELRDEPRAVAAIIFHVLFLIGLVRMHQSSAVQGYLVFYALRFGFFVYRAQLKQSLSPTHRRYWFYLVYFRVMLRVIGYVVATALFLCASDLHTSTQSNSRWEDRVLVNIGISIILLVGVVVVLLVGCRWGSSQNWPPPTMSVGHMLAHCFHGWVWHLLTAALDSFFAYLICLAFVGNAYISGDDADGPQLCPSQPCPPTYCSLFWEVVKFFDRVMAFDFCGDVRT